MTRGPSTPEVNRASPEQPTYAQIIATDRGDCPEDLQIDTEPDLGSAGIPVDRYLSGAFHDAEMARLWPKVWQMACRVEEVAEAGDFVTYDLGDYSLIIIRGHDQKLRAFHNSCLHRGTRLCEGNGFRTMLQCPFHGFAWNIEGDMSKLPCATDFPDVKPDQLSLPEANVDSWGGFVFVNMDPMCEPLASYLEDVPAHFASTRLERCVMTGYYRKRLPANWKASMEAFLEAFHVTATHSHTLDFSGEGSTQYDVFPGRRHTSRFLTPVATPSPFLETELSSQQILDSIFKVVAGIEDGPVLPDNLSLREFLADQARANQPGYRAEGMSTAEAVDIMQYFIFPNMIAFRGLAVPLAYRFRPDGSDVDSSIFELFVLTPYPEKGPSPELAEVEDLGDRSFTEATNLPHWLGYLYDQDISNLRLQQKGIRSSRRSHLMLSSYQEVRIRHFHRTLNEYVGQPEPSKISEE